MREFSPLRCSLGTDLIAAHHQADKLAVEEAGLMADKLFPRLNSWPRAWTHGSNNMNTTNMQQTISHNFSPTTGSLTITAVTMTLWVEENEGEFSWTVFSVFSWSPVLIYLRSKIAYYLDRISIYSVMYEFDFVCMYSFVRPRWKLNSNCILTLMFSKRYAYFFCSYGHEDWFVCLFLLMYH